MGIQRELSLRKMDGVITLMQQCSRLHVSAPYRFNFIRGAHALRGRFRKKSEVWSFPMRSYLSVMQLIHKVYGDGVTILDRSGRPITR